ncbi:hypothetical protein K3169_02510 [Pseudomonas phytophila]|uniref:Uncharacterized protein n=1 Tax=Pseudomonas phytophila TaxID=2867264 RepID=A0ABY6FFU7_9PSED|nr:MULTISPECIES: hypothetical protein [Pseudomonas]MCD5991873.1 hypothetical protein [Pseudomonas quasicaspiana]UXZ96805.1 hypothetical protein K3169_02510 [Pseudomonas phytophila]
MASVSEVKVQDVDGAEVPGLPQFDFHDALPLMNPGDRLKYSNPLRFYEIVYKLFEKMPDGKLRLTIAIQPTGN